MRLIDADKLKEEINSWRINDYEPYDFIDAIDEAPTVEPEITNDDLQAAMTESYHLGYELAETKFKRPRGKWEEPFEMNGKSYHKCTNCHISTELILIDNYCPNCGADMREEKE